MGNIKKLRKGFLIALLYSMITVTMSGCVYANNKSWGDMTPEEREEVRQAFEEERRELEEEFSEDGTEDLFAQYILDQVEQAMEEES